jgi:MinD superfamily P-loop ATPase
MDVFYFDRTAHKSVMRYPENCQSCGQCYMNCKGRSLGMTNDIFGYPLVSTRGLSESEMNRIVVTENGTFGEISKGMLP